MFLLYEPAAYLSRESVWRAGPRHWYLYETLWNWAGCSPLGTLLTNKHQFWKSRGFAGNLQETWLVVLCLFAGMCRAGCPSWPKTSVSSSLAFWSQDRSYPSHHLVFANYLYTIDANQLQSKLINQYSKNNIDLAYPPHPLKLKVKVYKGPLPKAMPLIVRTCRNVQ